MKPQPTKTPTAPKIASLVTILLAMAAVTATAEIVADVAGDYVGPSTVPVGWSYLYSNQASGGSEVALTPDLAIGNGGNSGFGRVAPAIFNLPGVLGTPTAAQYEIFTDGDLNAPALGTDLLLHPGPDAANNTVILRYTISAAEIASYGASASIAGSFRNLVPNGDSVTVSIYQNATRLFTKSGSGGTLTQANGTFNISGLAVAANDTISFVVNANTNLGADETALRGTIALTPVSASVTIVANIAGDYTGPSTVPVGWSYLYSNQASDGTEVALTPDLAVGNGGNSGFGRVAPAIFNLPAVLGTRTAAQYEIFTDGDLNAPVLGTDLLLHPGPDAANNTVILRYTISLDEISSYGTSASIAGSFRNLVPNGDSVAVSIYQNATRLFAKSGSGGNLSQANGTFNLGGLAVAANDTISFVVNANTNIAADETALRGTITLMRPRGIDWTGAASSAWNTLATNWKLTGNNAAAEFLAGDAVYFHDSPASPTVTIANGDVSPFSVTFDNTTATAYTLQGSNGIATGILTKSGAGSLTITNSNSTSGAVALNGGLTSMTNSDGLGSGAITFDGGALKYTGATVSWARNLAVKAGGGSVDVSDSGTTLGTSGTLSGVGLLTKKGDGTLVLGQTTGIVSTPIALTAGTLSLNCGAGAVTYSGKFTGSGWGLRLDGSGTLTLSGANDYTGTTTVTQGTLAVNNTSGSGTGSGAVTVRPTATLAGAGNISGSVSIEAGGFVAPGNAGIGTLTVGSAALAGIYQCQLGASTADQVAISGALSVNPGAAITITTLAIPVAASYIIASYGSLVGSLPVVTGIPIGYVLDTATAGQLKLVKSGDLGAWADSFPGLVDKSPAGDPDGDGICNLMEYIIGGDPRVASSEFLPTPAIVGTNLVLSYQRSDDSESDTTQLGQWSNDLITWTDLAPVLVNENGNDPDDMEIRIPLSNAAGGKLFGRLQVPLPISLRTLLAEMTDRDVTAKWPVTEYTLKQASSYDRRETNPADAATWFANYDSAESIRTETNGGRTEWVIMEHSGPGAVTRMWLPLEPTKDQQIIRFYFDGSATPAIEVPFNELMSGRGFVKPPLAFVASNENDLRNQLNAVPPVLRGIGGDLYLPIPYARGCKITLDQVPFYYIINYRAYALNVPVETFSMAGYAAAKNAVDAAGGALLATPDFTVGEPGQQATLAPGQELALNLPPGAAAVRNLRVRVAPAAAPQALRSIVLTAEFDGEPTIWCPVGEFFGAGARLNPVQDRFRTVRADGAMFSRWIMPYQSAGRLALKNLGSVPVTVALAAVTAPWQWDERSLLFHANWRFQGAFDTVPQFDWNYIEIQGRGVYVGDTLTAFNRVDPWYGEGDERVFIDGEAFPSHLGTGTEDYYGYAWGMTGFFSSPFISQPQRDAQSMWKGFTTTSRVRMLDGIPMRTSLKLDLEISHHTSTQLDYAVGTFWYARPGATHNRPPQPAAAALPLATL
jgi:autotransporter-associated beta strand protein